MNNLKIKKVKSKGRGVFADGDFAQGEIIEICPVIELPEEDTSHIDRTKLYDYYFGWGTNGKSAAIALGYGSLYNHSYDPNAQYEKNYDKHVIVFRCLRNIGRGEEITVNYHGNPNDKTPVWFEKRAKNENLR